MIDMGDDGEIADFGQVGHWAGDLASWRGPSNRRFAGAHWPCDKSLCPQNPPKPTQIQDLWPGQSVSLLKALHILTHNGGLNADSRRKLKQVQHLAQLVKPAIDAALAAKDRPSLIWGRASPISVLFFMTYICVRAVGWWRWNRVPNW